MMMMLRAYLLVALVLLVRAEEEGLSRVKREETSHSTIVGRLLTNYDKEEPPQQGAKVKVGIYVNNLYSVSVEDMEYSMSFYLRQAWRDPRLAYDDDNIKHITLAEGRFKDIWVPDTFFRNEKRGKVHDITVDNRLTRINSTGDVWHVTKISGTFSCPMDLHKYPLDKPKCPMMIESFAHTMEEIEFRWLDTPVDIDRSVQLPQHVLSDHELHNCTQTYTAGTFPCLEIRFKLGRPIDYFVAMVYMPVIFNVIISWLQFWMPIDAAASRLIIGFATFMAVCVITTLSHLTLPGFSYVKALDIWNGFGALFVFFPIIHFALINMMSDADEDEEEGGKLKLPRGGKKAAKMDSIARVAYPLLFLLFNLIYWPIYAF